MEQSGQRDSKPEGNMTPAEAAKSGAVNPNAEAIQFSGKTDIGMKRSSNQDSIAVHRIATGEVLGVICDGMGGANGGNVASAVAIDAFFDYVETALTAYAALAESMATDYAKRQSELSVPKPDAGTYDGKIQTELPPDNSTSGSGETRDEDGTKRRRKNQKVKASDSAAEVKAGQSLRISQQEQTKAAAPPRIPGVNYSALLESAVEAANDAVWAKAESDPSLAGMGTTLVAALVSGSTLHAVNVGDSRLYVMQYGASETGTVKQISRDHSYVQYLVDIGKITPKQATVSPYKNIITRSVGREKTISADTFTITLSDGMWHSEDFADTREAEPVMGRENLLREQTETANVTKETASETAGKPQKSGGVYILMCSDGLSNFLTDEEMLRIVCGDETKTLDERVELLIGTANRAGGADNISVVLIKAGDTGRRTAANVKKI